MRIALELNFSSLQNNFETCTIRFIKRLGSNRSRSVRAENVPITRIYATYHALMAILKERISVALGHKDKCFVHIKIVKSDYNDYDPYF